MIESNTAKPSESKPTEQTRGDLGEIVSLQTRTSPYFQLREKTYRQRWHSAVVTNEGFPYALFMQRPGDYSGELDFLAYQSLQLIGELIG